MYTFIESPLFGRLVYEYLSEEEYSDLQWQLATTPDAGDIIRGSGGVRIIYYWHDTAGEIWLLTLYAKNEAETIPTALLKTIREQFEQE